MAVRDGIAGAITGLVGAAVNASGLSGDAKVGSGCFVRIVLEIGLILYDYWSFSQFIHI
jgi:hypothetical protein